MKQKHVSGGRRGKQRGFWKEPWSHHQQTWFELPALLPANGMAMGESSSLSGPWFVSCNRCSLGSCTALKVHPIHLEVRDALCKDRCSWEHLSSKVGGGTTLSLWDGLFLGHKILLKTFSETCGVILFTKDEHQNTKRRKNTP